MMKHDGMTWNSIQQKIILQAFAWLGGELQACFVSWERGWARHLHTARQGGVLCIETRVFLGRSYRHTPYSVLGQPSVIDIRRYSGNVLPHFDTITGSETSAEGVIAWEAWFKLPSGAADK